MATKDSEFARLVTAHRHAIFRYGLRRLADNSATEDLVAETFIVAWRKWEQLPKREEELFWLYGIADGSSQIFVVARFANYDFKADCHWNVRCNMSRPCRPRTSRGS